MSEPKVTSVELKYKETNRKTTAFYFTMVLMTAVFIYGAKSGFPTDSIIESLSAVGLSYIIGISALDATRAFKINKKTNLDDDYESSLAERYKDK